MTTAERNALQVTILDALSHLKNARSTLNVVIAKHNRPDLIGIDEEIQECGQRLLDLMALLVDRPSVRVMT